ncbi:MAG TPA: DUF2231 domain-containing protein [Gemmatimonadaceae bacterium]|jgi:uncharacterized membrane protein|nr:DUF2231 domain-containing protein [Gemmatimonadaceae bacterium]
MFGIPLHPLVVHFPIVLSVLLPISVVVALWYIRKGTTPRRAWAVPLAMAAALTLSSWLATQTGESEEDRVEQVVIEDIIHDHEEAGERFLVLSGVLLLVAAAGLLPRSAGQGARLVTAAGALGLVAAGVRVGHSGGELVYRHGAASAYTDSVTGFSPTAAAAAGPDGRIARQRGDDDER